MTVGGLEGSNHAPPAPKDANSSAFVRATQRDTCTGETLLELEGDVTLPSRAFVANARSGMLNLAREGTIGIDCPIPG